MMLLKSVSVRTHPTIKTTISSACGVRRTDVVFAVLGLPELVDERLDAVGRGAQEAEAAEMAHLLALGVVDAVGEVDGVVEEGGLRGCGRDDGDLRVVSAELLAGRGWSRTVSLSSRSIFILAAAPVAPASPADTILVM